MTEAIGNRSKATTRHVSRVLLTVVTLQGAVLSTPAASEEVVPAWQSNCTGKGWTAPLTWLIEQTLVVSASGTLTGKAEVGAPDRGSQPPLLLLVLLGIDVRAGLRLQFDNVDMANVTIKECRERGRSAASPLLQPGIEALSKGNAMIITFRGAGKPETTAGFKLSGFSEAFGQIA